jgi:hypothetical protein
MSGTPAGDASSHLHASNPRFAGRADGTRRVRLVVGRFDPAVGSRTFNEHSDDAYGERGGS